MTSAEIRSRDLAVIAASVAAAAATAAFVSRRAVGGTRPLSSCEQDCIKNNPNDTQARLNCMLKCIADGKLSFADVLAPS